MAGWVEFFDLSSKDIPKQVFLTVGEISSLVWDKTNAILETYDQVSRVTHVQDLSYSLGGSGVSVAYLLVNPTLEILEEVAILLRGNCVESFFILIEGDSSKYPKTAFEYVKKKAQQSKQYYTITSPKTEAAQGKMVSHFLLRWGVTRETSAKVCSILQFSPGLLYMFDRQFLQCTGGQVLPSTASQKIVSELLGNDTPSLIVYNIINGDPVDLKFGADFSTKVINLLHSVLADARVLKGAWSQGITTLNPLCKATKLSQYQALRAWGLAESMTSREIRACEDLLLQITPYVSWNDDVLGVLSRLWKKV